MLKENAMKKAYDFLKKTIICFGIVCFICSLCGCNNLGDELKIYGGNHVKNSVIQENEEELAYELPIISSQKIKDFSVETYNTDGDGEYKINTGELTGGEKYKGWYYYFCNITVSISRDIAANFSIVSADMQINGQKVNYKIDDLKFYNIKGYSERIVAEEQSFIYNSEVTFCYQNIPNDKDSPQFLELEIQEDCEIQDFKPLDFIELLNLKVEVNNEERKLEDGIKLKKGDKILFTYNLEYKENVSKLDILKTTKVINYKNKDGKECIFVDSQGFMIIQFNNDAFIKNIIDTELGEK